MTCLPDSVWGFPRGLAVENLPANAGNIGSIPGWGRPRFNPWLGKTSQAMGQLNEAYVPWPLSQSAITTEAHAPRARAPQEKPSPARSLPTATSNPRCSNKDPVHPKINKSHQKKKKNVAHQPVSLQKGASGTQHSSSPLAPSKLNLVRNSSLKPSLYIDVEP